MEALDGPVFGLVTDPGPFVAAPPGSLTTADNVCVRRNGVVEPRGSFIYSFNATETTAKPVAIWDWDSHTYVVYDDNTLWRDTGFVGGFYVSFTGGETWSEITRDRLLFTCDNGVMELPNSSSTTAVRAGTWRSLGFWTKCAASGTAGLNWLANNYCTAYRLVDVRYVGQSPVMGAPSDIRIVRNNTGASAYVTLRCYIGDSLAEVVAGDQIQIYRSSKTTPYSATPSDEMRLRAVITITSADIAAGYVDFNDQLDDTAWNGAALYTNETQQGILQSNYRPYLAKDICYYNSMAFYAAHTSPHRVTLTANAVGGTTPSDLSRQLAIQNVGPVTFIVGAGTITAPAAYRTGGASQGSIQIGQVITATGGTPESADALFAANTTVTAYNPTTGVITLSHVTIGALAGGNVFVWDWIGVDDGIAPIRKIYAGDTGDITKTKLWATAEDATQGLAAGAPDMERCWAASYNAIASSADFRLYANETGFGCFQAITLTFERTSIGIPGFDTFTVYSTKPLAFDRYCDTVTGVTSTQDGGPNFLAFSKVREPEAVPLLNFQTIGSTENVIRRIARLQDSMMVFTDEGLYRVTGTDPESITIEPFDTTCKLIYPQLLAQSFGALWAFTTRGVMRVDYGGVSPIDQNIYRSLDQAINMSIRNMTNPWAFGSNTASTIAFGYTGTNGDDPTTTAAQWHSWIYHPKTNAWTRWYNRRPLTAASFRSNDRPLVGIQGGYATYAYSEASISIATVPNIGDLVLPITVTGISVDGLTITVAASTWDPQVGDAFAPGGALYFVVGVNSSTEVVIDRVAGFSAGNMPLIEAFPTSVEWVAVAEGDQAQDKDWTDARFAFDRWKYGKSISFSYFGYTDSNSVSETIDIGTSDTNGTSQRAYTYYQDHLVPIEFRRLIPRSVSREWGVRIGFSTVYPAFFSTAGMGRKFRSAGTRTARR